jgi:anti-sigma factor RsiW
MKRLFRFKFRYCRAQMTAFINGELNEKSRRRLARYIDECPDCYTEFKRQRELQRQLINQLKDFGGPRPGDLDRLWSTIQVNLRSPHISNRPTYSLRFGAATILLFIALILPLTLYEGGITLAAATQPPPNASQSIATEGATRVASRADTIVTLTVGETDSMNEILHPEAAPTHAPVSGQ